MATKYPSVASVRLPGWYPALSQARRKSWILLNLPVEHKKERAAQKKEKEDELLRHITKLHTFLTPKCPISIVANACAGSCSSSSACADEAIDMKSELTVEETVSSTGNGNVVEPTEPSDQHPLRVTSVAALAARPEVQKR
jgi:hypothetical protein